MILWPSLYSLGDLVVVPCTGDAPEPSRAVSRRLGVSWAALKNKHAAGRLGIAWGESIELATVDARLGIAWGESVVGPLAARLGIVWGEPIIGRCGIAWAALVARRSRLNWGQLRPVAAGSRLRWAMTYPVAGGARLAWDVRTTNPVARRARLSWSAPEPRNAAVPGDAVLVTSEGVGMRVLDARVSQAEGSSLWQGQVSLAGDSAALGIEEDDELALTLGGFGFRLIADTISVDRSDPATVITRVTLLSPLQLLDTPRVLSGDFSFPAGTTARRAVEQLLRPLSVSWELIDWTLPAAGLLFTSTTPAAAARSIVAAVGGLLESLPDGAILCRRRHPVSPPYDDAMPDLELSDADVLVDSSATDSVELCNRLVISDDGEASASDRIEYQASEGDPLAGVVRAWPSPWRAVRLVHTGRPEVEIEAQGAKTWTETETVEFIDGVARTSMPAAAVVGVEWHYNDLGAVSLSGDQVLAAVSGYSLARLRYRTTAYVWGVRCPDADEVQFVLEDEQ